MASSAFKTYAQENGGRVLLLFLLFSLALYQLATSGLADYALFCSIPAIVLFVYLAFKFRLFVFWILCVINYIIHFRGLYMPVPMSLPNEMLEIILLAIAIIDVKESHFERCANLMLFMLIIWCGFCTLELLNDTCNVGIQFSAWYANARRTGFQILYCFLVYLLYITTPQILIKYLYV